MDSNEIKAWSARWQQVAARRTAEVRAMSMEHKEGPAVVTADVHKGLRTVDGQTRSGSPRNPPPLGETARSLWLNWNGWSLVFVRQRGP